MNWYDPAERAALIERVGIDEYNRLHAEHMRDSIVAVVNGHCIRMVGARFGRLFAVGKTDQAFRTLDEAIQSANASPTW